ncbi:unnamed protein product [Phytomonas sp. EM1]|nr:unnamed protein product [Phytomonas sp. EM1]|eukprot:CCW65094.1 unnamed protein product [Phytomonas sp. isolate EM1]
MGCVKSKPRDRRGVKKLSRCVPKKEKPQKDLYAPFEPDEELSKAYFNNIHAIRSEGLKYGILEDDTADSPIQRLNDVIIDSKVITSSRPTPL